jgi:hypothetical protein
MLTHAREACAPQAAASAAQRVTISAVRTDAKAYSPIFRYNVPRLISDYRLIGGGAAGLLTADVPPERK